MSAHTPTPWKIDDEAASNVLEIWADDGQRHGTLVAQVWDPEADVSSQTDQTWADAHRIVAAVNACEGIPTEALESGVVKDLLEALTEILGPLATIPMGEGGAPDEQIPQKPNLRISDASLHRARSVIAKATGGAP